MAPRAPVRLTAMPIRRVLRAVASSIMVVAGVGGIPGASIHRPATFPAPVLGAGDLGDAAGVVDVVVHAAPEGMPIAGAHVRALAVADERAYLVDARDTDGQGHVRFDGLPRGETWILADAPDRARGSTRLAVDGNGRSVAIELAHEHALEVAVRDELGNPVPSAEVEIAAEGDPLPVGDRTGADGRAVVRRLAGGPWQATARAGGFEDATGRGKEGEPLNLVVRKLGAIAAHVVGEDGSPVGGARVAVAGATLWPARVATADAQGDVRIGSLAAATYALRATKDDRVSPIEFDVAVGRGQEQRVVLHLMRGRFVVAHVTDGDAADAPPIPSARVTLAEGGLSPFPLESTTDRAGRARLGPIAAGGAALSARAEGFVARGAIAVRDPPPAETRVALVRAGVLTGRVLDARGRPIDGATIELVGTDSAGQPIFDDPRRARFQSAHFDSMLAGPTPLIPAGELGVIPGPVPPIPGASGASAAGRIGVTAPVAAVGADPWVTRADGTFRAAPASPGNVRAVVRHPQYVEAQSNAVTLAPGGEAHVEVVMREGGTLEGRVLDARQRPVEHARVTVAAAKGTLERTTRTAGDGSFAFAALPDSVILTAASADDDEPEARLAIAIPEGGRQEVTVVLPEPREALPVVVVDETGWPVAAAQVSASSLAPDSWLRTTSFTDEHGDASLARARGLALRVEVRAPSRAPRVVTADGSEETLRVELLAAERATGEVVAERGRDAIAGALVTLYTDLGARRTRTDAQGTFALADLGPGSARLDVRASGFAPQTRVIAIPDSAGRRPFAIPRLELVAEGSVEGDVVDTHGDPVVGARVARDDVPTWLLVGSTPDSIAVTDSKGRFALRGLPEGTMTLEAYAPGLGRARAEGVKVVSGRTTDNVHVVIASVDEPGADLSSSGGVAVTLGETGAPIAVVIVSVVEGSEAERAGVVPGDVLLEVDGARVDGMNEARTKLSGPIAQDAIVALQRGDRTLTLRVPREAVRR